jgi:hypothetical protein
MVAVMPLGGFSRSSEKSRGKSCGEKSCKHTIFHNVPFILFWRSMAQRPRKSTVALHMTADVRVKARDKQAKWGENMLQRNINAAAPLRHPSVKDTRQP